MSGWFAKRRPQKKLAQKKQGGAALIIAIMIVALVAALAVEIFWHFNLTVNRQGSRMFGVQGKAYLDALEDFAQTILTMDMQDTQVDNLAEIWAQQQPPFPTDHGYVGGSLEDAQGRLNINQLQAPVQKNKNGGFATQWYKRYTAPQRRFIRLLQTIEYEEGSLIDQSTAESITDAVIDWLDPDSEVSGFGGAEGDFYSRLDPPMTIANQQMVSVSELSLVKGITPTVYESLLPLVIALPPEVGTNINTMKPSLLRALNTRNDPQPLSPEALQDLLDARGVEGFESIEDFTEFPDVKALLNTGADTNVKGGKGQEESAQANSFDSAMLSVASDFFIFTGEAMVNEHMQYSRSLMMRTQNGVVTIRRTDANF